LDAAGDAAVLNKSNPLLKKCLTAQQYVGMAALGSWLISCDASFMLLNDVE